MPAPMEPPGPMPEFIARHETLRMILEWITDRFADTPQADTSIAWEDGEEHDDLEGPSTL